VVNIYEDITNMAQQIINVGEAPNDGGGDPLRTAFIKSNDNFSELYSIGGITGIANGTSNISIPLANGSILMSVSNVANVATLTSSGFQVIGNSSASGTVAAGNITVGGTLVANGTIQSLGAVTAVTVTASGNLVGGNLNIVNNIRTSDMLVTGNITNAQLNVTGNVAAANILATGNIAANGTSITAVGFSATNGNIVGTGTLLSVTGFSANSGIVTVAGNTNIVGNVAAPYFIGNGSQLTGVTAAPANIFNTVLANGTAVVATSPNDTVVFTVSNNIIMTGNNTTRTVTYAVDMNPTFTLVTANIGFRGDLKGTVVADDSSIMVDAVNNNLYGVNVSATGNVTATGNISGGNLILAGSVAGVTTLDASGNITTSGNVSGSYFLGNGRLLTGIDTTLITNGNSNVRVYANSNVAVSTNGVANVLVISATQSNLIGTLNSTGNITAPYFLGNIIGNITGPLTVSGPDTAVVFNDAGLANSTAGFTFNKTTNAVATTGNLTATGNVQGSYILGNGAFLSGVITSVANINFGTSNVTVVSSGGNVTVGVGGTGNVTVFSTTGVAVAGNLSANNFSLTSNVTSTLNVTGNVVANNITVVTSLAADTGTFGNILNQNANGVGNIGNSSTYFNTVFAKATSAQYADVAERYLADAHYAPGTVVVFGGDKEVTRSRLDADPRVAGVISTEPAFSMNDGLQGEHVVLVALLGRVPCAVRGPVQKGDLMVSTFDGYARAEADPRTGAVIGKAVESFSGDKGIIEVVVGRL
jgi:hypothetical protein